MIKYEKEIKKQIRDEYSNGERISDLSRKYKIKYQTVWAIVHRQTGYEQLFSNDVKRIGELHEEGKKGVEIAEIMGVSPATVSLCLSKLGGVTNLRIEAEEKEIAWLAGVIDSEGSFSISVEETPKKGSTGKYRKFSVSIRPVITASNTCREFLEKVEAIVGFGNITTLKRDNPKHKIGYDWRVRGFKYVKPLLTKIRPYIIAHKNEAEIMSDFVDIYEKLISRPLKYPKMSKGLKRKRLANRETEYLLEFLVNTWFPKCGCKKGNRGSYENAVKLLKEVRKNE